MINAGWANNCGKELFTIGWVPCGDVDTGSRQYIDPYRDYANQAIREDEEFLVLLRAIIKVIDPWH